MASTAWNSRIAASPRPNVSYVHSMNAMPYDGSAAAGRLLSGRGRRPRSRR